MNKANLLIKKGLEINETNYSQLAQKVGWTKQNMCNKVSRDNFKISDFEKILAALNITVKFFDSNGNEIKV